MWDEEDSNAKWPLFLNSLACTYLYPSQNTKQCYAKRSFFVTQFNKKSKNQKCHGAYIPLRVGVKSFGITFRSRATTIIGARKNQGRRQRRDYTSLISSYTIVLDRRDDTLNRRNFFANSVIANRQVTLSLTIQYIFEVCF